mmetsp:Transcript_50190/g.74511  ORF Transcript_50190/g.74511 Transcript_50190/m.74511 type:complete len:268 (-) Transcript_50190:137-940(-)
MAHRRILPIAGRTRNGKACGASVQRIGTQSSNESIHATIPASECLDSARTVRTVWNVRSEQRERVSHGLPRRWSLAGDRWKGCPDANLGGRVRNAHPLRESTGKRGTGVGGRLRAQTQQDAHHHRFRRVCARWTPSSYIRNVLRFEHAYGAWILAQDRATVGVFASSSGIGGWDHLSWLRSDEGEVDTSSHPSCFFGRSCSQGGKALGAEHIDDGFVRSDFNIAFCFSHCLHAGGVCGGISIFRCSYFRSSHCLPGLGAFGFFECCH